MMTKQEINQRIRRQLACEFNCEPSDFSKEGVVITTPTLREERRKIRDTPFFLQMATLGRSAST